MTPSSLALLLLLSTPTANDRAALTSPDGESPVHTTRYDAPRRIEASTSAIALGGGFVSTNQDPEGDMPRDVAFLADGSAAVIANRDTDTATFFDVTSRTITDTVVVGDDPVAVLDLDPADLREALAAWLVQQARGPR